MDGLDASPGDAGTGEEGRRVPGTSCGPGGRFHGSIPINDETYDAVMRAATGSPGPDLPSAIPEILRVMRPWGYLMWTMREGYQAKSQRLPLLDVEISMI